MARVDLAAELADVEPETAPRAPATEPAPAQRPHKPAPAKRPPSKTARAKAGDRGPSAREVAEQLAAERYGVDQRPPAMTAAERQAIRRQLVARVEAELPAEVYARLLALADHYGGKRAALIALIEQADLPAERDG